MKIIIAAVCNKCGRNIFPITEELVLDCWYDENWNMWFEFKCPNCDEIYRKKAIKT